MNGHERDSDGRLRAVLDQARRLVPSSAPVVAVATTRTLHHAVRMEGEALPLVLASNAFTQPQSGAYLWFENPRVLVVDGVLEDPHLPDLLPHLEAAVADKVQLVVAAADFDQTLLATLVVNHQRGTLSVVALGLLDADDPVPLRRLAELAGARTSMASGGRLHVAESGTLPALLMTAHETIAIGAPGAQPLAVIHAGGETMDDARKAASRLRAMM